jgi:hypothetical protein
MKKLLIATAALLALAGAAKADVIVQNNLSGTGDNVIFNSISGDLATALLNGQHTGIVDFRDLSGSTTFGASANGNDIKIVGSQNLFIQVMDATNTNVLGTTTQVFSITGTGDIFAFVQANDQFGNAEAIQAFDLTSLFGALGPGQNGFTFTAINGEVMTSLRLLDQGGTITDFEHYRIDVAPTLAVPGPVVGAGLPGLLAAAFGLFMLNRYRRNKRDGGAFNAAMA